MAIPTPSPSIDPMLQAAKPKLDAPPQDTVSLEALTERFHAMMAGGLHQAEGGDGNHPNIVSEMLSRQDEAMRREQEDISALAEAAPHMSAAELTIRSMEMSRVVSINGYKMQVATSLASGSNKSLQSLLKNQ